MQSGQLRYPIDIYTPITKKNDYGEEDIVWEKKYSTRAKIEYTSGNRTNDNQEMTYDYLVTFTVRRYVPVDAYDFIHLERKGKIYKYRILSIEPNDVQQNLTIRTEVVNE